ncbi:DUF2924 domain-containing protein [Wolbachia endosymbiont of Dactylopius coccus]|nr:MAG: hypothetical protein TV42_01850 [Wolbachia endosymbiont of Dactylopius coccus]
METSELTLLDLQDFFEKLKGHVRSEVEKYVDEEAKEIKDKDKAATYITNKVLNNMVGNKPNRCSRTQNEEVIKALFIGKTLIGERKRRGERYEVVVSNEGKFIYNGKKYNAPSTVSEEITGKSSDGWEFFKVCLDSEEGLRKLSYHRKKFFLDKNRS